MEVSEKLGKSLDDVIKESKGERKGDRGHHGGRGGRGGHGHGHGRGHRHEHPKGEYKPRNERLDKKPWTDRPPKREFDKEKKVGKTKIRVENVHYNVTNKELSDLFGEIGPLKYCKIEWDDLGRSKETALVIFEDPKHAAEAIRQYDDAQLDGKTLKIRYVDEDDRDKDVPRIQRRGGFKKRDWK
mmetsp:Transcript_80808/g.94225  ORF Transcript_80808/g.94225 Transcript_80808/m.94225 type:complete len:185 (+) Transcript_80808:23-577(+)